MGLLLGSGVGAVLGLLVGPALLEAARSGDEPLARLLPSDPVWIDAQLQRVRKLGRMALAGGLTGAALLALLTRPRRLVRITGRVTPGTLGAIRCVVAGSALVLAAGEDTASIVLLPDALRSDMGLLTFLYRLPGFDALVHDHDALRLWEAGTILALAAATVGYRTRVTVPLAALLWFVEAGLIREVSWFTHKGILPLHLLVLLSFTRCGDGFSVDRLRAAARGEPGPSVDQPRFSYGVARFAVIVLLSLAYLQAGLSKLRNGGLDWWNATNVKSMMLADSLNPMHFDFELAWSVRHLPDPFWAALGLGGLVVELLGVTMIVSRRARFVLPPLIAGLHVGIWLMQNCLFLDLLFVPLVVMPLRGVRERLGDALAARRGRAVVWYDGRALRQRRAADLLHRLDLLGRFRLLNTAASGARLSNMQVQSAREDDPVVRSGAAGLIYVALRLPLLLPVGVVLAGLARLRLAPRVELESVASGAEPGSGRRPPAKRRGWRRSTSAAALTGLTAFTLAWWTSGLEVYPLTGFQMYSFNRRDGLVRFGSLQQYDEAGGVERARIDRVFAVLGDSRYRSLITRARETRERAVVTEVIEAYMRAENARRRARGAPLIRRVVARQQHWDMRTHLDDPSTAEVIFELEVAAPASSDADPGAMTRGPALRGRAP